jgi:hypothetical protein
MAAPAVPLTPAHEGFLATGARPWRRLQARLRSAWRPTTLALQAPAHGPGDAAAIDAALDALDAWAADHEGEQLTVHLSARWLLCCATPDATTLSEASDMAAQQWAHYFGLTPEQLAADWQLATVMHGSASSRLHLVCAAPVALVQGLQAVARERGLQLLGVLPACAGALQTDWTGLVAQAQGDATLASTRDWRWPEVGTSTCAHATRQSGQWVLTGLWADVAVTDPQGDAAVATVLPVDAPPAVTDWAQGWNFLGPRLRTSRWGWALLAVGVVAALVAADRAAQAQATLADAQAVVQRLTRGDRQLSLQAQAASAADAAQIAQAQAPTLKDADQRHAAQLAQWLGYPWADTLDHVDAASLKHRVVLTQFSLDLSTLASNEGVQPELKLQGAVTDDIAALRWLDALGPQAMLRARDTLSAPFATAHGTYTLRADVLTTGGTP